MCLRLSCSSPPHVLLLITWARLPPTLLSVTFACASLTLLAQAFLPLEIRWTYCAGDGGSSPSKTPRSRLVSQHVGVEARCLAAYNNALDVGAALCQAVEAATGSKMLLAHVTEEQARAGYYSSTFSFNLPPPDGSSRWPVTVSLIHFTRLCREGC
jgi:hypothetical protein